MFVILNIYSWIIIGKFSENLRSFYMQSTARVKVEIKTANKTDSDRTLRCLSEMDVRTASALLPSTADGSP